MVLVQAKQRTLCRKGEPFPFFIHNYATLQTDKQLFESVQESTHLFTNSSLDFDAITLHPLPIVHSVTGPFMMTTLPQPIFFGPTTEVDSSCLAYLKQLKLYTRERILNSLPTHWAEWTTHNVSQSQIKYFTVHVCYSDSLLA